MTLAGHEAKEIALSLQMHQKSVMSIQRSPLFQTELARQRANCQTVDILTMDRNATLQKARSILEEASEKAANKLSDLIDTEDPTLQFRSASKILDTVFGKDGGQERAPVINISAEKVELINMALKEMTYAIPVRQENKPPANGATTCSTKNGSVDVYQGSEGRQIDE